MQGFIQQLAVSYVSHGYFFYVAGAVPIGKDPRSVDAKLVERYGIGITKWARARRKRAGTASLQYIRHQRFFLIIATHGEHRFFQDEKKAVRDCRRVPIKCFGYAISSKRGHVHVRIEREEAKRMTAQLIELGLHWKAETVARAFLRLPFEPYAPVRRQLLMAWRQVNKRRKTAGFDPVPIDCIRMRRRIVEPFAASVIDCVPLVGEDAHRGASSRTVDWRRIGSSPLRSRGVRLVR